MDPIRAFISKCNLTHYDELPSPHGEKIIKENIDQIATLMPTDPVVLDVGVGLRSAFNAFTKRGWVTRGVTVNESELDLGIVYADQNDLPFPDAHFDLIWARHVLEHSVIPFYTLHEFKRVLKPNGWLYVEVPSPDTDAHHEANANHYSVLTLPMWCNLLNRSGFNIEKGQSTIKQYDICFDGGNKLDRYYSILCQPKQNQTSTLSDPKAKAGAGESA